MQREEGKKFLDFELKFGQDKGGINLASAKVDVYLKSENVAHSRCRSAASVRKPTSDKAWGTT